MASSLKYPKRKFAEAIEQSLKDNDMIFFDLSYYEHIDSFYGLKNLQFYCSSQTEKSLDRLWNWDKFKSTNIYGEFIDMCQNFSEDLVFTYSSTSDVLVLKYADNYSGTGGIFVREDSFSSGVVIEPLKNFLKALLPSADLD